MRTDRTSTERRRLFRPGTAPARLLRPATAVWAAGLLAAVSLPVAIARSDDGAAATTAASESAPMLTWQACDGDFQCATARIPLDHRNPRGRTISVAVMRHRATDGAHRIGSLFVNGGGPGAQLAGFTAAYRHVPSAWRARYDIVAFDPRGFGQSTAVRCFPTAEAESAFLSGAPIGFPVGARETSAWVRTWSRFTARCTTRDRDLLEHVSTADVARDMDLLRQALGDPTLNYVGLSYGTLLGTTYANLFPATVGRMALDGNVDPVAWTDGKSELPSFVREGNDQASAAVLKDFLDLCGKASQAKCAFSAGTATATRAKYATLLGRLRRHPVTMGTPPDTQTCGYACGILSIPLGSVSMWPEAAELLQQMWEKSSGRTTSSTAVERQPGSGESAAPSSEAYTGREQYLATVCSDSPNPRDPRAYEAAARLASARSGPSGLEPAWVTEPCAGWPLGKTRYTGPWNRRTANPILLLNNTEDPATSYRQAVTVSRTLARARLLTVEGYGHTVFSNPSACAMEHETRYLLTGALPPTGTVCKQDTAPFS
ncbi:alpha/beta hydrolase [Actinoallomurus purpureus]|uniref:alpha/beta hydrolase n=1 Tax=Actinoallomurus purpureus TaxID=478114 RepID=UPI0020928782|nr:alpha/beta hydrolase [Actinoallomurus purpureus]MCO6004456.1 alpha/beta hydrolase [Actinoallomurus purpureus]